MVLVPRSIASPSSLETARLPSGPFLLADADAPTYSRRSARSDPLAAAAMAPAARTAFQNAV
jgi:hypothetical protein